MSVPKAAITLTGPTSTGISQHIASGEWPTPEAYVEALVAREQENAGKLAALHAALDEEEASGTSERTIDEIIGEARERHLRKGWAEAAEAVAKAEASAAKKRAKPRRK